MKMKTLVLFLLVALCCSYYTGCGGGSSSTGEEENGGDGGNGGNGGSGGTDNVPTAITVPSETAIKLAITTANPKGIAVTKALSSITLPTCTATNAAGETITPTLTYSITNLPTWLSFDSSTRVLSLAAGVSVIPTDALSLVSIKYNCTYEAASGDIAKGIEKSVSASTSDFVFNDMDGGGISDGYEYLLGKTPLVNRSFGWVWLNDDNISTYTTSTTSTELVPTGLVGISDGLNGSDADDETTDLDNDGVNNLDEITAGTNIFVPTSSGTFAAAQTYAVNTEPQGIDCADYDNDGDVDLAVTNRASNKLSILLNQSDGTFAAKSDTAQGADPFGVISADFNGDGNLDLVITNATDNDISVRLGVGDGTFGANTDYAVGESSRYIYATTDFDKDGNLDLALTNAGSDNVSIFFGNGDGSFDASVEYAVGDGPIGLVAADFDNDGDIDLAAANDHVTTVSVLLNDGDGTFADKVDYTSGTNPWGITAGDFNGDFILDLAVANYNGGNVSILLGVGDGTFGDAVTYTTASQPNMLVSADFNGDGAIDLAVACRDGSDEDDGQVSVLLGVGDGTFSTKVDYANAGDPLNICSADFNGDNLLDLAVVNYDGDDVSIFLGQD